MVHESEKELAEDLLLVQPKTLESLHRVRDRKMAHRLKETLRQLHDYKHFE
jgi:hypothetical protein